jgi:hypothetical protein
VFARARASRRAYLPVLLAVTVLSIVRPPPRFRRIRAAAVEAATGFPGGFTEAAIAAAVLIVAAPRMLIGTARLATTEVTILVLAVIAEVFIRTELFAAHSITRAALTEAAERAVAVTRVIGPWRTRLFRLLGLFMLAAIIEAAWIITTPVVLLSVFGHVLLLDGFERCVVATYRRGCKGCSRIETSWLGGRTARAKRSAH